MATTFLDRLKKKDVVPTTPEDDKQAKVQAQLVPPPNTPAPPPAEQLKVDILQTPDAILIYSQIAGAGISDFNVTIEGDGDVITIKGTRTRPNGEHFENATPENKEHVLEECTWGKFYRQIILPAEVDPTKTEAKLRDGVLMLLLPLKDSKQSGIKIDVTEIK